MTAHPHSKAVAGLLALALLAAGCGTTQSIPGSSGVAGGTPTTQVAPATQMTASEAWDTIEAQSPGFVSAMTPLVAMVASDPSASATARQSFIVAWSAEMANYPQAPSGGDMWDELLRRTGH